MADKELAAYVMERLSGLGEVRSISMMGGYLFYYKERIFGGIYENGFLVKDTKAARNYMPDSTPEPPYEGGERDASGDHFGGWGETSRHGVGDVRGTAGTKRENRRQRSHLRENTRHPVVKA